MVTKRRFIAYALILISFKATNVSAAGELVHSGLPACSDEGVCDSDIGISGGFEQTCPALDGEWVSFAFPVVLDGGTINAVHINLDANIDGGDVYILADCNGNPDVSTAIYTGCGDIIPGTTGDLVYPVDPPVAVSSSVVWVVMVYRSDNSFRVAFNKSVPDSSGVSPGLGFANLSGGGACGEWSDLADFLFGYCFCVSLEIEPPSCDGDTNGDGVVDPIDAGYVLSNLGCTVNGGGEQCIAADANQDGSVDPLDAGYVLSRFGDCT